MLVMEVWQWWLQSTWIGLGGSGKRRCSSCLFEDTGLELGWCCRVRVELTLMMKGISDHARFIV